MLRSITIFLIAFVIRLALWFRYKIKVKGLENLNSDSLNRPGGILFLPNHPTIFVDPCAVTLAILSKFRIRPMIIEYMYYYPLVNRVMRFMNALPIPDFDVSSNSLKRKKSEKVISSVIEGLRNKENFLIYPAGRVKVSAHESIGGASGVHRILSESPDANVVLVRTKGLWGSKFSRAQSVAKPLMFPTIWWGVKQVLKNLIFFMPRREVIVELVPAPKDFPYQASRLELNQYLEKWYNLPDGLTPQIGSHPGDSLVLVPYSFWNKDVPIIHALQQEQQARKEDISKIPKSIQEKIVAKIALMTDRIPSSITPELSISNDLGLDSLDTAELAVYLHEQFDIPSVPVNELTSVGRVMGIASKQIVCKEPLKEEISDLSKWYKPIPHKKREMAEGETIPEVFLNISKKLENQMICGDERLGLLTYKDLRLRSIVLANHLKKLPGEHVGVLLPASVAAIVCILACQLAGKVPVMINWTVGPRHLETVVKLSGVQTVLSSWSFIDKLEGVDLSPIEDSLVLLEDIRREIGFMDKLKAFLLSKRSTKAILNKLNPKGANPDSEAVLLFTSGTESMPKGVPLTHRNIVENQRAALQDIDLYSDDIVFGILPPFHTFGFSISCILPILSGIKVAFYPDPTDGKGLAQSFEKWRVTIMCGAPTFIKGLLKVATSEQLKTMRLCVTGAEKAPPELFEMLKKVGKADTVLEGYGITECSPILTMNRVDRKKKGVGQALHNVELCVVNPESHEILPPNHQGLILARGPNVFHAYLNPGIEPPFMEVDGKSWYRTGDLGELDDEGFLTISGRMKRFIKIGPEMVSLSAIEDALLQVAPQKGWPTSQEGPTMAICAKEQEGEKPKIFLFTKFPLTADEANKALKDTGYSNLIRVSAVQQVEDIPLMGTGKVNYRALESRYMN
ncbi:Bifunctional protein aas [Chlamydiales bacterium STE3]|nr:Bifunctional protein aas [Chlamydiales bacterium STE3]